MNTVEYILNNWDYTAAFKLYDQLTGDSLTKEILSSGESIFNSMKLRKELEQLVNTPIPSTAPAADFVRDYAKELPNEVFQLEQEWREYYKEASYLQSQLLHAQDNEKRCEMAFEILSLFDKVDVIWEALKHYDEHQTLPEEKPVVEIKVTDPVDLMKRRINLQKYISSAKNGKLNKKNLPQWEAEYEKITKILDL